MKIYVIIYQEDDYSCGDEDCCGTTYSIPCVVEKAFTTTEAANKHIETMGKDWHYEIKELSL